MEKLSLIEILASLKVLEVCLKVPDARSGMFTTDRPQTDGQTRRVNRVFGDISRII